MLGSVGTGGRLRIRLHRIDPTRREHHMATGTLITTPFGYETTAAEVVDGLARAG